jgi:hypothetical protein
MFRFLIALLLSNSPTLSSTNVFHSLCESTVTKSQESAVRQGETKRVEQQTEKDEERCCTEAGRD